MALQLFEHNEKAYKKVKKMLAEEGKAAVIHPTGSGKSYIAFKLIEDNLCSKIVWLSPSEYIFNTQKEAVLDEMDEAILKKIQFYTYSKRILLTEEQVKDIYADYIILDEFHRCGALRWGEGVSAIIKNNPQAKLLGLSATNIRYLDNQRDMAQELFDGNIASKMTLAECIVRGILPAPKYVTTVFRYQQQLDQYKQQILNIKNTAVRDINQQYFDVLVIMANPVNIYSLSRIQSEQAFNNINKHLSGQKSRIKQTEIASLRLFVDKMVTFALPIEFFDGFFYSFKIPQIGKEFDLLKLSNDYCINIEFKSTSVGYDRILKQLVQNKHYLNHLSKRIELYTVITDTMVCYKLSMENTLIEVDISEIKNALESLLQNYIINIDNLFRPADYLVSPLNTPDKFLQGEYFLTQQQEEVKGDFLKKVSCLKNAAFFHITGKPGTGKTLLLYDLAKALSTNGKTLLVHCGILSENQVKIKNSITNLDIISAKQLKGDNYELSKYSFILVDEAHRIYYPQFTRISTSVYENKQICMFSSDPGQILSRAEQRRQIVDKINQLDLSGKYELSDRIRTNKELISFMRQMIDLNDTPKEHMNYPNISLNYANDSTEARLLLNYYHNRDFIFINFSKTNYGHSPYSEYIFEEDFDTHHVIGQEFDNVVILMDNSFFYNSANTLSSISHPNPDYLYPNLFYQGITRAREKLAIIIVETPELFEKMASIVSN